MNGYITAALPPLMCVMTFGIIGVSISDLTYLLVGAGMLIGGAPRGDCQIESQCKPKSYLCANKKFEGWPAKRKPPVGGQ